MFVSTVVVQIQEGVRMQMMAPSAQVGLIDWLTYCEQVHPVGIDMGLDRIRKVAAVMGLLKPACPIITVAGTNGKGSTCAMLEAIYTAAGYRVGVYTSPHLVHFEERCRLGGQSALAADLVKGLHQVEQARQTAGTNGQCLSLTYFEFTTLAILWVFAQSQLDVWILEVGLGGRLDAVNVLDADCAVITSIDLDHTDWLGTTREAIGFEKAGIMRQGKPVVVSDPMPPESLAQHASAVGAHLYTAGVDFSVSGDRQQWAWSGSGRLGNRRYSGLAYPALRGANQLINAAGVLAVTEVLRELLPVSAQSVRVGLSMVQLPGRFQIMPGQPAVVLDVAHNAHSVAALVANLDAMGYFPVTHAVVGVMADKDVKDMLQRMAPLVNCWYFTDLPTSRACTANALNEQWQQACAHLPAPHPNVIGTYSHPTQALSAAIHQATSADRIIVFGSFWTVGDVLAHGVPKLSAAHVPS